MKTKAIYQRDGLVILPDNPFKGFEVTSKDLTRIYIYRSSEFGFQAHASMNKFGIDATIKAFKSAGIDVEFDLCSMSYIMQDEKEKFEFILKHGKYKK